MATIAYMSASYVVFGEFDSRKRYLRSGNPSANLPIVQGVTFFIGEAAGATTHWNYSVAGYTVSFGGTVGGTASYTLVKT